MINNSTKYKGYSKNIENSLKTFQVLKQTFVLQNIREEF